MLEDEFWLKCTLSPLLISKESQLIIALLLPWLIIVLEPLCIISALPYTILPPLGAAYTWELNKSTKITAVNDFILEIITYPPINSSPASIMFSRRHYWVTVVKFNSKPFPWIEP